MTHSRTVTQTGYIVYKNLLYFNGIKGTQPHDKYDIYASDQIIDEIITIKNIAQNVKNCTI